MKSNGPSKLGSFNFVQGILFAGNKKIGEDGEYCCEEEVVT